jgi:hypothetical protein
MCIHLRLVAHGLLALSAGVQAAPTAPLAIQIDAGGVEVEFIDDPQAPPMQLRYRGQGSCQPDVAIATSGNVTSAAHVVSCHGTGKHQGTLFLLTINGEQSLNLALNAGAVTLLPAGLERYRQVDLHVAVGGMGKLADDLHLKSERNWLLGAVASGTRYSGCCTLAVKVRYGAIGVAQPGTTPAFTTATAP